MTIYFYSSREQPYGCFSNFSRHGISIGDVWWPTVEHYFQAQKFEGMGHTEYVERIHRAATPKQAAELGRSRSVPLRADWEQVKDAIMLAAVRRKFETHEAIRAILLATGDEEIVENAPRDYYWGGGADGSGLNRLGTTLMEVRARLRI
ncbi:MAG TPA: NADAR family protein [Ktedonobacterales bacterium]|nr:NADAR family protein [Ktedonobacterales bacterium]